MKKIVVTILTIITTLCFAIGLAGCRDKDTIVCKKDFGTPISATVRENYESRSTLIKEESKEQLKSIYLFFKSVKYRYTEDLSEEEIDLLKKFEVSFSFDNPPILKRTEIPIYSSESGHTMYCFVDESGQSILRYVSKYYISEEGAVDYEKLMEYYNAHIKYTS